MIGKIISFVALVAVAAAASARWEDNKPFEGVDPNTLSCDSRGEEFLLLPHYKNCSKFYMCAHGQEVEFECAPNNLNFDFERQTCNWPWASPCVLRVEEVAETTTATLPTENETTTVAQEASSDSGVPTASLEPETEAPQTTSVPQQTESVVLNV